MAKKKKLGGKTIVNICLATLILLYVAVLFAPSISALGESYNSYSVAFGYSKSTGIGDVKIPVLDFSFLAFLACLLPLIGLLLSLLFNRAGIILSVLLAVVTLAGAIMLFFMPSFAVFSDTAIILKIAKIKLQVGAIISSIVAIIGAILIFIRNYLK